jgi:hypothetical protein
MSAVEYLPDHGDLRAPTAVMQWLIADEAAPPPEALAGTPALPEGTLHPRLAAAREIVRAPLVEVSLERGERQGRAWVAPAGSVLLHPLADGRARLVTVSTALFVDALVRLNDVGPRPRVEPAVRIVMAPGDLAAALAARDPGRAQIADIDQAEAFARMLAGLREHWRVAARWEPREGAVSGRHLEVLDADHGYWVVIPDDPTVELWPTTPSAVYRSLCALLPTVAEVKW